MNRKIILLDGPPGSGKSSLSKVLQKLIADKRSETYEISGEMCEKIFAELF